MRVLRALLPALLTSLLSSANGFAQTIVVLEAGMPDGFALPTEPTSPDPHLQSVLSPGQGFSDFDEEKDVVTGTQEVNALVLHRFELPSCIVGATLELRVRAIAGALGVSDIIAVYFDDGSATGLASYAWRRYFGEFDVSGFPYEEGIAQPLEDWDYPDDETIILDLSALPIAPSVGGGFFDAIPHMNSFGFIDVLAGDETATDYMTLTLEVAGSPAVQTSRAGVPPNPTALLAVATSSPVIGSIWNPVIDHSTFATSAVADFMIVSGGPANIPLGIGTLLCDPSQSPFFLIGNGGAPGDPFQVAIPDNCGLVGAEICTQGGSILPDNTTPLANALDITIGAF